MQSDHWTLSTLLDGIRKILLGADFLELAIDQRIAQRIVAILDAAPNSVIQRSSLRVSPWVMTSTARCISVAGDAFRSVLSVSIWRIRSLCCATTPSSTSPH